MEPHLARRPDGTLHGRHYPNAVSEWFFWSEFGVRYNFIAVDYLVYTNEVVGNIMESYPVVPLSPACCC